MLLIIAVYYTAIFYRLEEPQKAFFEIGQFSFVVPQVVKNELNELLKKPEKKQEIELTLNHIKNFKTIPIFGSFADKELLDYVSENRVIVATMDKELKKQIKITGSSIMSFSNDKIVLES